MITVVRAPMTSLDHPCTKDPTGIEMVNRVRYSANTLPRMASSTWICSVVLRVAAIGR